MMPLFPEELEEHRKQRDSRMIRHFFKIVCAGIRELEEGC